MIVSEHTEAVIFMRAVAGAVDTWPELRWLAAIPNGGKRARKTAADLKAEGVKRGVPDYLMPVPRGPFVGLAIELKRMDGGRTSPEQKAWLSHLRTAGWMAVVAYGWEAAWRAVQDYMAQEPPQTANGGVTGAGRVSIQKNDARPVQGHTGGNRRGDQ